MQFFYRVANVSKFCGVVDVADIAVVLAFNVGVVSAVAVVFECCCEFLKQIVCIWYPIRTEEWID